MAKSAHHGWIKCATVAFEEEEVADEVVVVAVALSLELRISVRIPEVVVAHEDLANLKVEDTVETLEEGLVVTLAEDMENLEAMVVVIGGAVALVVAAVAMTTIVPGRLSSGGQRASPSRAKRKIVFA